MKYIIEIENEPFGRNDDPVIPHGMDELYRAKGFKSLVFDKNGLDKLIPYTEPDRKAIEDEVWGFAWEVLQLDLTVFREIFGYDTDKMDYRDYKSKYEAWKEKDVIHVGDEIISVEDDVKAFMLDCADYESIYVMTEHGCVERWKDLTEVKKTGRTFPEVAELLQKMRGEEE